MSRRAWPAIVLSLLMWLAIYLAAAAIAGWWPLR